MASSDLSVGTEFAGYRITGVIGRGGMSSVYSAEHIRLGRPAALKVLSPVLAADDAFRARFIRESQLAATLDHPSILTIYDAGEADGVLYIAMRLVRGEDLGSMLEREGPLSLARVLSVLEQVGSALDHAHAQGLIHRDVKPANILIEKPSERAYLTDFGVVKETSSRGLTKTGYFLGTFEYAAPEQIEGRDVDGRTDVYALGCVLYESLTAEAPFLAQTEGSVIHSHLVEPPPRATPKRPDLPAGVDDVIATAMAKAMDDRYPTCGELVRALRAVVQGSLTAPEPAAPAAGPGAAATVFASPPAPQPAPTAAEPPPAQPEPPPTPQPSTAAAAAGGAGDGADGVPPAASPAPAAAPPPRTVTVTRRRVVVAGVVVAALVAAGIAAALLIGRGNSTTAGTATSTTTATGASTAGSTASSGPSAAIGLQGVVPKTLLEHCKITTPINAAAQTASCTAPQGSTSFWPDTWSFSLYRSTPAALKAYNSLRAQSGIGENFGRCDRTSWSGEGAWLHNPEAGAPPKPGGRRFCYFQGNVAVIVWLHEKLAQPNHIDMIGIARASGSDHFNLYGWYSFWHHTVGKCLAPGCVARLS